ncbi:MAG: MurT ligase domain-containing protein [Bifidobacteriaceae bacterium]|jgi:UDP-N-acetylmuramyl tripeptide synthase|nr:MurT ligase domain-containing protein [Bifidobacteriaceae bacterium]
MLWISQTLTTIIGKTIRAIVRLKSGGSAYPGYIVEKINPEYLVNCLNQLPLGVAVISGTNGKTTTTKITTKLLQSTNLKVFTNPTGSNFVRGIISAILEKTSFSGKLKFDIAILELDEAHAAQFIKIYKPKYSLLLNVTRDQLDRFGEIDKTASYLQTVAKNTTQTVVLNANDSHISKFKTPAKIAYFDINKNLQNLFPNDDQLHGSAQKITRPKTFPNTVCKLHSINHKTAEIEVKNKTIKKYKFTSQLKGVYNLYNATAALALASQIMPLADMKKFILALENVKPAFGRGETIKFTKNGLKKTVELILVKNPSGFRLALKSFSNKAKTLIIINDNYADSRDISWLWDVDFSSLAQTNISTAGSRAYDMALKLSHDKIIVANADENIELAISKFLNSKTNHSTDNEYNYNIFASYTAMLEARKILAKYAQIAEAGLEK